MSDSEDESKDRNLKLVIIGDGSSGKVWNLYFLILMINYKNILNLLFIFKDFFSQ